MNRHYMFCTLPPYMFCALPPLIDTDISDFTDDDFTGDIERIAKIAEITERG